MPVGACFKRQMSRLTPEAKLRIAATRCPNSRRSLDVDLCTKTSKAQHR